MAAPAYDKILFEIPAGFARLTTNLASTFQGLSIPNGSPYLTPSIPREQLLVGTGAGQFNVGSKLYTATASGNTDYDLTTLLDPLGNAINLANARYLVILNYATTAGFKLVYDGTVTNAWLAPLNGVATAQAVIPPGWTDTAGNVYPGRLILGGGAAAGLVTSSTSKVLRLAAGANSIPHAMFVIGCNA